MVVWRRALCSVEDAGSPGACSRDFKSECVTTHPKLPSTSNPQPRPRDDFFPLSFLLTSVLSLAYTLPALLMETVGFGR